MIPAQETERFVTSLFLRLASLVETTDRDEPFFTTASAR